MPSSAELVPLGPLAVSRQGYGCMGLSSIYGASDDETSVATIHRALDLGVTMLDTADIYGEGHNETLVGRAIRGRRGGVVIASKFGNGMDRDRGGRAIDGRPAYARAATEASLRRLGVEQIDLYYLHRLDPQVPVEDTVGELARLKQDGKIGAIGLSEVDVATLRRAHAVHPIAALQSEYSLWTRDVEAEILPACRELGVGFVGFAPLGRGFLAGALPTEKNDRRNKYPRYQAEALTQNMRRRAVAERIAERLGASLGQVALAWVMSKGVVPIPGTRHIAHLEANFAAGALTLAPEDVAELEAVFFPGAAVGERYPPGSPLARPALAQS